MNSLFVVNKGVLQGSYMTVHQLCVSSHTVTFCSSQTWAKFLSCGTHESLIMGPYVYVFIDVTCASVYLTEQLKNSPKLASSVAYLGNVCLNSIELGAHQRFQFHSPLMVVMQISHICINCAASFARTSCCLCTDFIFNPEARKNLLPYRWEHAVIKA